MFLIGDWRSGDRPAVNSDRPPVAFFCVRLRRLLALRFAPGDRLTPVAARQLDQAIYSTYRDLRALHRETEARALVDRYRGCAFGPDAEVGSLSKRDKIVEFDERGPV
jgi:hypothetical protein